MKVAKAVAAAVGTVCTSLSAAFADDVFNNNEIAGVASTVVLGVLTVWGVWRVPNVKADAE